MCDRKREGRDSSSSWRNEETRRRKRPSEDFFLSFLPLFSSSVAELRKRRLRSWFSHMLFLLLSFSPIRLFSPRSHTYIRQHSPWSVHTPQPFSLHHRPIYLSPFLFSPETPLELNWEKKSIGFFSHFQGKISFKLFRSIDSWKKEKRLKKKAGISLMGGGFVSFFLGTLFSQTSTHSFLSFSLPFSLLLYHSLPVPAIQHIFLCLSLSRTRPFTAPHRWSDLSLLLLLLSSSSRSGNVSLFLLFFFFTRLGGP